MIVFALLLFFAPGDGGFRFDDFADVSGLRMVGTARQVKRILRLTPAQQQTAGGAWFGEKQPVVAGFDTEFAFQFTERGGLDKGADGLAFVVQTRGPRELAGRGGAGGFAPGDGWGAENDRPGIPESIAVFFDTHQNEDEPSNNYVGVYANGRLGEMRWPPARLGVSAKRLPVMMKDGRVHRARIAYERPMLTVWLDGTQVVRTPVDLSPYAGSDGKAWVGFTASTGGGWENHDVLSWRFEGEEVASDLYDVSSRISYHLADCMEGRNLCTPEKVVVEEKSAREWRVILPAHLQWAASVPGQSVEIVDARGTVCFGPNGDAGCLVGPAAIRQKVADGRVWFSAGRDGSAGQGFVEFVVRLR